MANATNYVIELGLNLGKSGSGIEFFPTDSTTFQVSEVLDLDPMVFEDIPSLPSHCLSTRPKVTCIKNGISCIAKDVPLALSMTHSFNV